MLLRPTKHNNPDQTVVAVATQALKRLQTRRVMAFEDLRVQLRKSNPGTERLFVPALGLLYLLGLVEYRPKADSVEYTGK
jgi:hypothetical protein